MIEAMREVGQSSFDFFGSQETKKDKKKTRKQEDDFVFEFMDIFTSPIIVYDEGWGKGLPEDLLQDITLGRNIQILKKEKELAAAGATTKQFFCCIWIRLTTVNTSMGDFNYLLTK